jgi:hypothetical protein
MEYCIYCLSLYKDDAPELRGDRRSALRITKYIEPEQSNPPLAGSALLVTYGNHGDSCASAISINSFRPGLKIACSMLTLSLPVVGFASSNQA